MKVGTKLAVNLLCNKSVLYGVKCSFLVIITHECMKTVICSFGCM